MRALAKSTYRGRYASYIKKTPVSALWIWEPSATDNILFNGQTISNSVDMQSIHSQVGETECLMTV